MMTGTRIPAIELLMSFKAVFGLMNFSQAATKLNVSQSAISHRIRRLEEEIGLTLFDRSPQHVVPTEAARRLFREINPALTALEAAFRRADKYEDSGSLEFEVEPAFSTKWLAGRLKRFTEANPTARLHIHLSDKLVEFSGKTEFAVKWGKGEWPGYQCKPLMHITFTPMCSPDYCTRNNLDRPEALVDCTLLHDRSHDTWVKWARLANLDEGQFRTGHIIADTPLQEQAAVEGHGVIVHALELASATLARGDLVMPFPDLKLRSTEAYFVLTKPDIPLSILAESFLAWLRKEISA